MGAAMAQVTTADATTAELILGPAGAGSGPAAGADMSVLAPRARSNRDGGLGFDCRSSAL